MGCLPPSLPESSCGIRPWVPTVGTAQCPHFMAFPPRFSRFGAPCVHVLSWDHLSPNELVGKSVCPGRVGFQMEKGGQNRKMWSVLCFSWRNPSSETLSGFPCITQPGRSLAQNPRQFLPSRPRRVRWAEEREAGPLESKPYWGSCYRVAEVPTTGLLEDSVSRTS